MRPRLGDSSSGDIRLGALHSSEASLSCLFLLRAAEISGSGHLIAKLAF